ncbi:peptidase [Alkalihalobacillus sp. BA299]|uniref:peptidase n=1 Tax=Alkalihalobacillus sp. BA299 TaxID=2815938 RepID=UPI001ADC702F|nr:peptidase [Alkalihalobacillus sp. BA299]
MKNYQSLVHSWIQENNEIGIELLQQLVRNRSVQANEYEAQQVMVNHLKKLDLEIDEWEVEGDIFNHPYFCSTRKQFLKSPNVVAVKRGKGKGKSIILNGHIDVVPEGDVTQWSDDPYSGKIIKGKMYGRGTTDMKGGTVSLLLAIQALKELGIELKGDIIFQSVIEEESGGAGTLETIIRGYKADAAIIPEPTNMKIFPKQQGSMWFRLTIKGRSAHGGTRYEGVSAIEKALPVISAIQALEKVRNSRIVDPLYENKPIPIPINLGVIRGGDWPSSVADEVIIEGRIGVAPDEAMSHAQEELKQCLKDLEEQDPWFKKYPVGLDWFGARWVPGTIDEEHPLMAILQKKFQQVKNIKPRIEASPWGTDGGLLEKVGGIPVIVFGPGTTEIAHFPNEYIELDRMFEVAEIIALTLIDWCGVNN